MIDYNKYWGVIYDVDLCAPPEKRWLPLANELNAELKEMIEEIREDAGGYLEEYLTQLKFPWNKIVRLIYKGGVPATSILYKMFGDEYVVEIESIAKEINVQFSDLLLANLTYEICQYSEYRSACSSYSLNLKRTPILARNMDWAWPDTLGHHTIVIRFHKKQFEYYAVTFPGFVGILSAFSPGRWAMTLNMAPLDSKPKFTKWPALMLTRYACDRSKSYKSLINNICEWDTQSSLFVHLVGMKKDEHCVLEGRSDYWNIRNDDLPIIQTNHFVEEDNDEYCDRYSAIERRMKVAPKTMKDAAEILSHVPILNKETMQSMVFSPKNGKWLLKVRPK